MPYPTPHGDKLRALLENEKLPARSLPMMENCIESYWEWIAEMTDLEGAGDQIVEPLITSLNRYKLAVDFELIFDNADDFLYRQKGQLKIDNTVLEEFLPRLVGRVFADPLEGRGLLLGPTTAFSQLRFESDLLNNKPGGGMAVRSKDHDFAMARPIFLRASHSEDFGEASTARTHLAYVAAEIKTNLDKTMFQEASATAYDLKLALPSSRYFLLCEWLDMTPISTAVTSIEEVIVLRKARRLPADVRRNFATAAGRAENRQVFHAHLNDHPFAPDAFRRFLGYVEQLVTNEDQDEDDVLERGWF